MISYSAKKSVLYKELDQDTRKQYFDFTCQKFLHNIDTLYYVIKLDLDWKTNPNALLFKDYLRRFQRDAMESSEAYRVFTSEQMDTDDLKWPTEEWLMNGVAASKIYRYDLQQPDRFAVFIAENSMNEDTPELIVQLRSQFLWLEGEKQAVLKSLAAIENLLSCFGIMIRQVKENRIDYAYHTNYIQNPTSYFKHENINKMQQSRFSRGSIEFSFRHQWEVETDYITLGRKKSNNLFFRIYDKTKEVIQQGYKQFFIKLWYMENMISYFDMYCIEKAFMNPSADNYKYLDVARLEFYLEFGKDNIYKDDIQKLLNQQSKDYEKIIDLADLLTPKVTKILNVELETKRKFYSTLDNTIDNLLTVKTELAPEYSHKLFRILDNKKLFHDFITRNTSDGSGVIRFIDYKAKNRLGEGWKHKRDYPTSDFWSRLQSVSMDWEADDVHLIREYQKNLSMNLLKKRIINSMSTYSLYKNREVKNNTFEDSLDFISILNESDLEAANTYKEKKYHLLKDRLNSELSLATENKFGIIDLETGEIISTTESCSNKDSLTIDYNESKDNSIDIYANNADDIYESLLFDLNVSKEQYESMLSNPIHYNQKTIIQLKLDKINEQIKSLN